MAKILIIGNGYIGNLCSESWPDSNLDREIKIRNTKDVFYLLDKYRPERVLNAAGVIGRPNTTWCENHIAKTQRGNVSIPRIIAEACLQRGVYLLHIGSCAIFNGQSPSSLGWLEHDEAKPVTVYSKTKWLADLYLRTLPVGIARIHMPFDHRVHSANLLDKLISYSQVYDYESNLTVVDDMIYCLRRILELKGCGIFHVTNPGVISNKQIIDWYKEFIDPNHITKFANNQNSYLLIQSTRLASLGIAMRPVAEAVRDAIIKRRDSN